MNKASWIFYTVGDLLNAVIEVFATMTLLCLLDPVTGWNLSSHLSFISIHFKEDRVNIDGARITLIVLIVILLALSFVLYVLGRVGSKMIKNHTHRIYSHICAMIISTYYFITGFSFISLSTQAFLTYLLFFGAANYFLAGLTGIIGHRR